MSKLLHSPTLESVKMVENTIKKYSQEYTKYQLWKKLPKKMMYQTYCTIFDYLLNNKIMVDKKDGIVFWTYDPDYVKDQQERGLIYNAKDFD
ncbi:MAG: hypothetical protein ACMXX7_02905 [Candidatus Woesearchaeota archaeon]